MLSGHGSGALKRVYSPECVEWAFSGLRVHRVLIGLCVLGLAASRVLGAYLAKLLPVADRPAHAVERPVTKLHDHEEFVHAVFVA